MELDRANKEKEVVSSKNRHLEQRLTGGDSEHGGASELERLRSQVEVSGRGHVGGKVSGWGHVGGGYNARLVEVYGQVAG